MRTGGACLVGIWLVMLPFCTYIRAFDWQDEMRLWRYAHGWAPQKVRPVANLGRLAHLRGEWAAAELWYRHALTLTTHPARPQFERRIGCVVVTQNLVRLLSQQGRIADAMEVPPCAS